MMLVALYALVISTVVCLVGWLAADERARRLQRQIAEARDA